MQGGGDPLAAVPQGKPLTVVTTLWEEKKIPIKSNRQKAEARNKKFKAISPALLGGVVREKSGKRNQGLGLIKMTGRRLKRMGI